MARVAIAIALTLAATLAGPAGSTVLGQDAEPLAREVAAIQSDLESRIGVTLARPVLVLEEVYVHSHAAVVETGQDLEADLSVQAVQRAGADGTLRWEQVASPEEEQHGDPACILVLDLDTLLAGSIRRRTVIAHELFHCFQSEIARASDSIDWEFDAANRWLKEGLAEWVAEAYVGVVAVDPDGEDWWVSYLSDDEPLTSHDYAATGFFHYVDGLLRAEGRTLWDAIVPLASIRNRAAALRTLFGTTGDVADLDGWAASVARRPELGPLFDLTKPSPLPMAAREPTIALLSHGDEWRSRATPAWQRLVQVAVGEVEPHSALIIHSDGPGVVGWEDGRPATRFEGGAAGPVRYCLGEACTCGESVRHPLGDLVTPTIAWSGTAETTTLWIAVKTCYGSPEEAIEAWLIEAGLDLSTFQYMGACPSFGECVDVPESTLYSQSRQVGGAVHQVAIGGDFHPLWDLRVEEAVDGSGWQVAGACDHHSDGEACFEALERG